MITPTHHSTSNQHRRGVTVLEVLFATGIVIFGLVGIASLITVAGRQASDSNELTEGQAYAQTWYNEFIARGFNDTSRWVWYNDQELPADRPTAFNRLRDTTVARATSAGGNRTNNRHAVCIDPTFFADATTANEISGSTFGSGQAFRPGLFPYYQDDYNPSLNPSSSSPFLSQNHARLLRVSLNDPTSSLTSLTAKQIERIFLSSDDLSVVADEEDKSLPATILYDTLAGKSLPKGEYSWFATLCPREFLSTESPNLNALEDLYTLSIVVCRRRDRTFVPSEDVPRGERVLNVTASTNFVGGGGGRVLLSGTTANGDSVGIGDWVMFCRHQAIPGFATPATVCRWYRVLATDVDATIDVANNTWEQNVVLDGPDWIFDSANPTQATVVSNVVTVLERVVPVQ